MGTLLAACPVSSLASLLYCSHSLLNGTCLIPDYPAFFCAKDRLLPTLGLNVLSPTAVGAMERLSPISILDSVSVKAGNLRCKGMQMNMQMSILRIYEKPQFQGEGTASASLGPLNPGPCQCRKAL